MRFFLLLLLTSWIPHTKGHSSSHKCKVRNGIQKKYERTVLIYEKSGHEKKLSREKKPKLIQKKVLLNPFKSFDSLIGFLLDMLLLLILLLSTLYGYRNGVLSYVAMSLLGTIPAYFFRYILEGGLTAMVGKKMAAIGGIANITSLVILVLLYFFFSKALYKLLHHLFRETSLVHVDNLLGAIFFLIGASIFVSVSIIVLAKLSISLPQKYTDHSFIYHQMIAIKPEVLLLGNKVWKIIQFMLIGG